MWREEKAKKSKERREEPLGTMSYQTSSKRSPPFWLLIGARKLVFIWHHLAPRGSSRRSLLFFVPYIFFRPFRLSLAPFIFPWVSEDGIVFEWEKKPFQFWCQRFRTYPRLRKETRIWSSRCHWSGTRTARTTKTAVSPLSNPVQPTDQNAFSYVKRNSGPIIPYFKSK